MIRTAELAIGMMVLCFPTLPGLVQKHSRKPSHSIINGSARSPAAKAYLQRSRGSPDEENTLVEGDYFELDEARREQAYLEPPKNVIVSEISRGTVVGEHGSWPGCEGNMPSNGIMRTIRIEQRNVESSL